MRSLSILLVVVLAVACRLPAFSQHALESGLYFSSHEVITDKRTSLNLTPWEPFHFPDGFSLAFEANFRRGDGHYGNIFRMIGNGEVNIDLVSNQASPFANFWLVLKEQVIFSCKWEDIPNGAFDEWMKIRVQVDTKNSIISIFLNGLRHQKKVLGIAELEDFHVIFGACKNKSFLNTDVCPMTLNNILVYDEEGEVFRNWKLSKHARNKVYDEVAYAEAEVLNPNWQIDRHIHWEKEASFHIDNLLGVTQDETTGRIFLVDEQAVYIHHLDSAHTDSVYFAGGQPYPCRGNQIIYNTFTDELWSYDFEKDQVNIFNFDTCQWSHSASACVEPDLWHHNRLISPLDTSLITYGGYGHYTYKSKVHQLNPKTGEWKQMDVSDKIYPRYLSAAGFLNRQEVLIYGGFGSKSGRQELSPEFYYDLYTLNLQDFSVQKRWALPTTESPYVASETLITDTTTRSFYTLIYNRGNFETALHLVNFSIDTPEKQIYADSIPYKFLDTDSRATFFLNETTAELVTITTHNADVHIHTLAYPPLLPEDVYQKLPVNQASYKIWGGIACMGLLATMLLFLYRKKSGKKAEFPVKSVNDLAHANTANIQQVKKRTVSSIYFLGGFQVFDKKGEDITSDFTPTIRHLFLLIYLSTLKNGKGVSSVQLKDTLWFDKSETKARNNRNVNISKLRTLLDKIGNIDVGHDNTYWNIRLDTDVYCDYAEALALIQQSRSPQGLHPDEVLQLIEVTSLGALCPNIQTEWMDNFKADFANAITDTLSLLPYQQPEIQNDHHLLLRIADCMLKFDMLNEDAIAIKCSALYFLGKKGLAKHSYDAFCRDYKSMLGIDYPSSFNNLLNHNFSMQSTLGKRTIIN